MEKVHDQHTITASYTTLANDNTDNIRDGLIDAYNTARDNFLTTIQMGLKENSTYLRFRC